MSFVLEKRKKEFCRSVWFCKRVHKDGNRWVGFVLPCVGLIFASDFHQVGLVLRWVFFFSVGMGLFFSFFLLCSSSPFLRFVKLKKGLESLTLEFYLFKNFHIILPEHQNRVCETQFPSINLSLRNSRR